MTNKIFNLEFTKEIDNILIRLILLSEILIEY